MPNFEVKKASDNSNNGYSETVEYKVLHQANVESNHNKFYSIEIQKNNQGHYRLFTHYGRLGISSIYEIRENIKGCKDVTTDFNAVKSEFDTIIKNKLRGKRNKETGEMESYVEVDTVTPTVGSENIRGKSEVSHKIEVKASLDTSIYNPDVGKLLDQLIEENIHSITSHTSIKYTSDGFATELGHVTKSHVLKARQPLTELNNLIGDTGKADPSLPDVKRLNSLYFSLIPKPFSRKITEEDMILDSNRLDEEFSILDQLETAVTMGKAMSGSTSQRINALGTEIDILQDNDEIHRIKKYIRESKALNHRGMNVWAYDAKKIYKVSIPDERSRYESGGKSKGNIKEVFHGSSNSNCLSILKGGLIIPSTKAAHVTGRLNGDAIYGAIQSTKALNYSLGFWGGKKTKYNNNFIFLVDFAMGKTYETTSSTPNGLPTGYDSVWAKPGYLHNHELMVYNLNQATIKYIIEMTPGGR